MNADIQEITLDINITDGSTPSFYLTYPDNTNDILSLPDSFNVYEGPAVSKKVQLENPVAGHYRLIISQNNSGTFGSNDLDWKLTLRDLGNTNALTADIASVVAAGDQNAPVKLFYSTIDNTAIPFYFTIPGGQAVHKVVMSIESASTEDNLYISVNCPDGFLPATTTRYDGDFSQGITDFVIPIGATCTTEEGPRKISFIKDSSTEYTVEITFCQDIPSGSCAPNDSPIGDEEWIITVKGLDAVPANRDSVKVSFSAFRNDTVSSCTEEELTSVHIEMNHPPIAIINNPTDGIFTELHSAYYYDVVAGPPDGNNVNLAGEYYSDSSLAITLPIKWEFDDGDADPDYTTDINPPSTHFIPGAYEIVLTVKDDKNRESTDRAVVFIDNPPIADISNPAGSSPLIITGGNIGLEGDDGIAALETTHSYEWDFGNGNSSISEAPGTELYLPGKYDLSFTVTETLNKNSVNYIRTAVAEKQIFARPVEEALFPAQIGVPRGGLYQVPPTIDGDVDIEIDKGWTGAYRLTYNAETLTDVVFQALRDNSQPKVYLSFEVTDPTNDADGDFIIIGFRKTGDPSQLLTNSRILIVYPYRLAGSQVEAYKHNGTDWDLDTVPSALEISFSDAAGGVGDWNVEMAVPTSAGSDWIDISNEFLFYFDVFVTNDASTISYIFPKQIVNTDTTPITEIQQHFTDPRLWATCYKTDAGSCTGVQVDRLELGVKESDGTDSPPYGLVLHFDGDNEFRAKVTNDTQKIHETTGSIDFFDADHVFAQFKIANWGFANEWIDISDTDTTEGPGCTDGLHNNSSSFHNNPTCEKTIGLNGSEYYYFRWDPGTEADWLSGGGGIHQCVWVGIDSLADTYIKQTSAWTNMDFPDPIISGESDGAPAPEPPSGFRIAYNGSAKIGTFGIKPLPEGHEKYKIIMLIETKEWQTSLPFDPKFHINDQMYMKAALAATGRLESGYEDAATKNSRNVITPVLEEETSFLRWIVKGYADTGRKIVKNNREIPILEPIGSFGHVLQFLGDAKDWEFTIEGAKKLSDNVYQLEITPGESVTIDYTIIPIPASKFNISLHAGAATPLVPSTFADDYKTGYCVFGDIGYKINNQLSIVGLFGYNYFPAKNTGMDDTSIINIALNLKRFFPVPNRPKLTLGVGVGPEMFIQDFNTVDWGYDVDLSLGYKINKTLTLEGGAVYHSNIDQENWFIQTHGGIVINF